MRRGLGQIIITESKYVVPIDVPIHFFSEEAIAEAKRNGIWHPFFCPFASVGLDYQNLPAIIIRESVWDSSNRSERRAICEHEKLHILLGHHYFLNHNGRAKRSEAEVDALMPEWAKRAVKRLRKRWINHD